MWVVKRATSLFNSFCTIWQNKLHVFCCPFFRTLSRPSTHARFWVWCRARVQGRELARAQKCRAPGHCVLTVFSESLGQSTALSSLLSSCFKMAPAKAFWSSYVHSCISGQYSRYERNTILRRKHTMESAGFIYRKHFSVY